MQELATEIILTLGQAFEIAYQMALQEQQQSKQEAAEGATADPTPSPPPEGAVAAGVTTTLQPDVSKGNNSLDKQTDVNSEIDDITQKVTNTHMHKSVEPAAETTQQPVKNDDATTTTTTTTATSSKKGPGCHPDSSRTNKSRADPKVVDPAGQAAVVGTAALGQQHTACHNTTRTESTV